MARRPCCLAALGVALDRFKSLEFFGTRVHEHRQGAQHGIVDLHDSFVLEMRARGGGADSGVPDAAYAHRMFNRLSNNVAWRVGRGDLHGAAAFFRDHAVAEGIPLEDLDLFNAGPILGDFVRVGEQGKDLFRRPRDFNRNLRADLGIASESNEIGERHDAAQADDGVEDPLLHRVSSVSRVLSCRAFFPDSPNK